MNVIVVGMEPSTKQGIIWPGDPIANWSIALREARAEEDVTRVETLLGAQLEPGPRIPAIEGVRFPALADRREVQTAMEEACAQIVKHHGFDDFDQSAVERLSWAMANFMEGFCNHVRINRYKVSVVKNRCNWLHAAVVTLLRTWRYAVFPNKGLRGLLEWYDERYRKSAMRAKLSARQWVEWMRVGGEDRGEFVEPVDEEKEVKEGDQRMEEGERMEANEKTEEKEDAKEESTMENDKDEKMEEEGEESSIEVKKDTVKGEKEESKEKAGGNVKMEDDGKESPTEVKEKTGNENEEKMEEVKEEAAPVKEEDPMLKEMKGEEKEEDYDCLLYYAPFEDRADPEEEEKKAKEEREKEEKERMEREKKKEKEEEERKERMRRERERKKREIDREKWERDEWERKRKEREEERVNDMKRRKIEPKEEEDLDMGEDFIDQYFDEDLNAGEEEEEYDLEALKGEQLYSRAYYADILRLVDIKYRKDCENIRREQQLIYTRAVGALSPEQMEQLQQLQKSREQVDAKHDYDVQFFQERMCSSNEQEMVQPPPLPSVQPPRRQLLQLQRIVREEPEEEEGQVLMDPELQEMLELNPDLLDDEPEQQQQMSVLQLGRPRPVQQVQPIRRPQARTPPPPARRLNDDVDDSHVRWSYYDEPSSEDDMPEDLQRFLGVRSRGGNIVEQETSDLSGISDDDDDGIHYDESDESEDEEEQPLVVDDDEEEEYMEVDENAITPAFNLNDFDEDDVSTKEDKKSTEGGKK